MKRKIINLSFLLFAMSLLNIVEIKAQDEKDSLQNVALVNVAFGKVAQDDLLGAVSTVNVSELLKKNYYANTLDGLQGIVGGYTGNIWGQSPLILVDGVPRETWVVNPSQIETISVLKGANSVALYGSRAAKGAVLITTKRGKEQPLSVDVRANTGFYVPKRYPVYLNAAEYMSLYNEACVNDGIEERYSPALIYNTAAGTNPYRYPNTEFYNSDYLRSAYNKSNVIAEVTGGNNRARFYTNFGMSYNNSLLKYGEQKNNDDMLLNVKSNIDMDITNWLKGKANAAVVFSNSYRGLGDFWGAASSLRPNLFSPLIPISMMDPNNSAIQSFLGTSTHIVDGQYLYGGISTNQSNAIADMLSGGYSNGKTRAFLFDVDLDANLGMVLDGLSFKVAYSVDYANYYLEQWVEQYAVYEPTWANINGQDMIINLTKYGVDKPSTSQAIQYATFAQTMSFRGLFNYDRKFGKDHHVSGLLGAWGFQIQNARDADSDGGSAYHRTSNANLVFQAGYNFRQKYYFDFSSAWIHSAKLPENNRNAFSPSATLGWRMSDESFFKDNISFIDNLKLTASYANLKQDLDISDYYMYMQDYQIQGIWFRRDIQSNGIWYPFSIRGANPELTFVQREEFRTGLELATLNKMITLDANYFLQYTKGLLTNGSATIYPSYFNAPMGSLLPQVNFNEDKRTGIDFTLNLNKKIGQVDATLGLAGMYYTSKATVRDEVYEWNYQYRTGRPIDSYWGYVCEGFFKDQADIDNHATQTFGDVKPGDLKYEDVNKDGVIDSKDQVDLGRNGWAVSPFTCGLNLTLKWNGFTFFAMGTGQSGAIGFKDGDYHWVRGEKKYSEIVWGHWTEETKNTATYPRLTTTENSNNYRNSTFWMYKNNRFDLTKVQLTYDFSNRILAKTFFKDLSLYISGESLLTISKERKMMETNRGGAPYNRFYNIGFKTSF